MDYKAGDNIRLTDGRTARVVRAWVMGLYDVKIHDSDHDRISVLPEDIACRVRRATVWVDDETD